MLLYYILNSGVCSGKFSQRAEWLFIAIDFMVQRFRITKAVVTFIQHLFFPCAVSELNSSVCFWWCSGMVFLPEWVLINNVSSFTGRWRHHSHQGGIEPDTDQHVGQVFHLIAGLPQQIFTLNLSIRALTHWLMRVFAGDLLRCGEMSLHKGMSSMTDHW